MTFDVISNLFTKLIDVLLVWMVFYYILKNIKNTFVKDNLADNPSKYDERYKEMEKARMEAGLDQ